MTDLVPCELVLFQGYPGSGKSSAAASLANSLGMHDYDGALHFSIGNYLRSINAGYIESKFSERLRLESAILSKSQKLDDNLVNAVVDEYLGNLTGSGLVLIDGYPLYSEQVSVLRSNLKRRKLSILGLLIFDVPEGVA